MQKKLFNFSYPPMVVASHPLLQLDNVMDFPHLGYMERGWMGKYFSANFRRVLAFAAGKPYGLANSVALAFSS